MVCQQITAVQHYIDFHYGYGNIFFLPVTAGSYSSCTVCITLHDSHSASFDYRRQRRGSEADLMTRQFRGLYFVGHPKESLYKTPSMVNGPMCDLNGPALIHLIAPPLSVITTLEALCLGLAGATWAAFFLNIFLLFNPQN